MNITTSDTLIHIDGLSKAYAKKRELLAERVQSLESEITKIRNQRIAGIKSAAAEASDLQAQLRAAVEANPELFIKPRTLTLHGIRIGFQKGKGKITWTDEESVVKKICALFPPTQHDTLIRVRFEPIKDALANLDVATLRKIGCVVEDTGDQVIVKASDTAIDKFVAKLLDEGAKNVEDES